MLLLSQGERKRVAAVEIGFEQLGKSARSAAYRFRMNWIVGIVVVTIAQIALGRCPAWRRLTPTAATLSAEIA